MEPLLLLLLAGSAPAGATEPLGLALDLGLASAYVWRGWNVFQDQGQRDQNALLAPGVTWSVGDTGLTLGWWGAFQLTGPNRSALVDAGLGAEQDLFLGYDLALGETLSAGFLLTGYLYPLADEARAGTAFPAWLEPAVAVTWDGPVSASLSVSYVHGLQDVLAGGRNVYIRPGLAWSRPVGKTVALEVTGGVGYKVFTEADVTTNTLDVLVGVAAPVSLGVAYVAPGLNLAWTNLDGGSFSEGLAPWGGVNVGVEL